MLTWWCLVLAWKVHYAGYGKGVFEGERSPTDTMGLEQYYGLLQKKKADFIAGLEA